MVGPVLRDLAGGGAFRWLLRVIVVASIALLLVLRLLLKMNIFLAILLSSSLLFLGLLIVWLLVLSGRVRIKS